MTCLRCQHQTCKRFGSERIMDTTMRGLRPRYLQVDEIWTYVAKKARKARHEESKEIGDQWVFVGMDAQTKLVASFRVGKRSWETTTGFMEDLYKRMADNHRRRVVWETLREISKKLYLPPKSFDRLATEITDAIYEKKKPKRRQHDI